MDIIGNIKVAGNIRLSDTGSSELQNVYVERLTSIQEETLATTLTTAHYSRLIFNLSEGVLRIWNGGAFETVGAEAGLITSQLQTFRDAFGPMVSPSYTFATSVLADLPNIPVNDATNVFELIKAVDTEIGVLKAPVQFGNVVGINLTSPTASQFLKYNGTSWINADFELADVSDITVTAQDLNYTAGVTSNIQEQLTEVSTTLDAQVGAIASLSSVDGNLSNRIDQATQDADTIKSSVGLNANGTIAPISGSAYLDGMSSVIAGMLTLDTNLKEVTDTVASSAQFISPYLDQTEITVTHNKGVKYVQVIVVNAFDQLVTPASVVFTDLNSLVVTLNQQGSGTVIVS